MMGSVQCWYADYGDPQEFSNVIFPIPDLTAVNFAATAAKIATLLSTLDAIVIGVRFKTVILAQTVVQGAEEPSSPFAQQELKWKVYYHNNTSKKTATLEIPCADLAKLSPDSNERADSSDEDISHFITRFQAGVELEGEAVTVDDIKFVTAHPTRRRRVRP